MATDIYASQAWQDISTAPKANTQELLLYWWYEEFDMAMHCYEVGAWQCVESQMSDTGEIKLIRYGWAPSNFGGEPDEEIFPTHWQPLPKPPIKKD